MLTPKTGDPVDPVTPLVRSKGLEFGVRTSFIPGLQTALSVYRLDFASELLFVGDAGTTEAGRPSRRTGFELANFYKLSDWLTVDADIAFAKARFRDAAAEGNRIPGAIEGVASMAVAVDNLGPWFGAVQFRYFGPRPLIADDSVRSKSSATVNARLGYKITPKVTVELDVFNLTNRRVSAIDYHYTSRLPGEPAEGVASLAVAVDNLGPWFGAVQFRYFGPRPLIKDDSVRSKSSATVNARLGYKIAPKVTVELDVFNLTNRRVSAIDYYYTSRLPGEAAEGVAGKHFHPIESRTLRVALNVAF